VEVGVHGSLSRLPGLARVIGRRDVVPEQRQQWACFDGGAFFSLRGW
jgi:hypothetical protein